MKSKRVILDTNLWISFLISNNFNEIDKYIKKKEIILIFSLQLLEEFFEVVKRPKFKKFFSPDDVESLLDTFDEYAELVEVQSDVDFCRDKKDNFLLNLSIDANADFLVTGDKDLLVLNNIETTEILTFRQLIDKLIQM